MNSHPPLHKPRPTINKPYIVLGLGNPNTKYLGWFSSTILAAFVIMVKQALLSLFSPTLTTTATTTSQQHVSALSFRLFVQFMAAVYFMFYVVNWFLYRYCFFSNTRGNVGRDQVLAMAALCGAKLTHDGYRCSFTDPIPLTKILQQQQQQQENGNNNNNNQFLTTIQHILLQRQAQCTTTEQQQQQQKHGISLVFAVNNDMANVMGNSVQQLLFHFGITTDLNRLIVIHDDPHTTSGAISIKDRGACLEHSGVKNIIQKVVLSKRIPPTATTWPTVTPKQRGLLTLIHKQSFYRIGLGIGHPEVSAEYTTQYALETFSPQEEQNIAFFTCQQKQHPQKQQRDDEKNIKLDQNNTTKKNTLLLIIVLQIALLNDVEYVQEYVNKCYQQHIKQYPTAPLPFRHASQEKVHYWDLMCSQQQQQQQRIKPHMARTINTTQPPVHFSVA